jgi:glycerate kinase
MKKVVIIPDSFKGTMSSQTVCNNISQAIRAHHPEAEVIAIPVADGGEGTVDAYLSAVGGVRKTCVVTGPLFEKMTAYYGILNDGTAVIEMAACAGLPLVEGREDPMLATTYGVGELIKDAVQNYCKRVVVGLGGAVRMTAESA